MLKSQKQSTAISSGAFTKQLRLVLLEAHGIREHKVEQQTDENQVTQHDEGPRHVMADHLSFTADKTAGGNTHACGLRSNGLAYLGSQRVQGRTQQNRQSKQLARHGLNWTEHGVGRCITA